MKRGAVLTLKTAGSIAAIKVMAAVGGPMLAGAAVFGTVVVIAMCWVVADSGRAERLAILIQVARTGHRAKRAR